MSDPRLEEAGSLAAKGDLQGALAGLKALLQADPQNQEAKALLADVQDRLMLDLQIREKVKRAKALLDQGQRDAALKLAADILKVAPDNAEARSLAGLSAPPPPPRSGGTEDTAATQNFPVQPLSLEPLAPAAPAPQAVGPADQPFEMESLPAFGAEGPSIAAPAVEKTLLSGSSGQLAPGEMAKVRQFLQEGEALYQQGRYQDAIDTWTRIFILDESNQEAEGLIARAKEHLAAGQGEVEFNLNEGIAAFNAGEFARARPLLEKVLQAFPGHREAQYYLGRMGQPQAPEAAAPTPAFGGGGDEFELEDSLTAPTGPEMRAERAPEPSPFQWETETGQPPVSPAAPAPASPAQPAPAAAPPLHAPAAPGGAAFVWDEPPAGGGPAAPPAATTPITPAPLPAARPTARVAPRPQRRTSWGLVAALVGGLIVVGLGIFLGARWLMAPGDGGQPGPVTTMPKPPRPPAQTPAPPQPAPVPAAPTDPRSMPMDDLLKGGKGAVASKDFQRALLLYQEALNRDPVNSEAQDGLAQARAALEKQNEENERNQRFLKEYQNAVKSFQEQDYAESLRVAWRLIYPDDTLARQLGKRDAITSLIRDGYYNWTVLDLKQQNVRGADKNLKDLMEFTRDAEAAKLQAFVKKYLSQPPDDNYKDVVRNLDYRPLKEGP